MAVSNKALVAHLLRRTSFGPFPGRVGPLASGGIDAAIDSVLAAAPMPIGTPPDFSDDAYDEPIRWWIRRMSDPAAGLHEKMVWFWHGIVTISHDKVFWWNVEWQAHATMRARAMGGYRQMLKALTIEPAMLLYLDGDWSTVEGPNENYARELQELFSIGQANVVQDNVTNGALALAGWHVDWDNATAVFDDAPWSALESPVPFLGKQVKRYNQVVDAVCDHSAMPAFIADKAWRYFVGVKPSATKLASLAATYRQSDLDATALVSAILRDPSFLKKRMARPRYPVEWVVAAMAAAGMDVAQEEHMDMAMNLLWQMGQVPFYPPSVAGWPSGNRWLSPSLALARAAMATESEAIASIANAAKPVNAALARCSIYEASAQTKKALNQAAAAPRLNSDERAAVLLALCLASPEFALA